MSITRKYNDKTKAWEVIAASDASSISVRDQQLIQDGQTESNVASVLQRMDNDIKTLKGNVSWLAEHGGGGSGSGGGGGSVLAEIKVNGKASGSSIVLGKEGLTISVQSSNSKLKWSITANGAQIVLKSATNTTQAQIGYDDIQNAGITKTFQLSVVAFNEDTLTNVYWDGTIQIATVDISTQDEISYNFVDIDKPSAQLVYSCTVGVIGQYFLYINDTRIGDLIVFSDKKKDIVIQISDLVSKYGMTFTVGANTITAMLQSATDQDIKSQTIKSQLLLIANEPVISCSSFSTSPSNRSNVYINIGNQTVVQTPYTVYFKNGFYKAQVYTNYGQKKSWDSITNFNSYNQYYENASCTLPAGIAIGANIQITIAIFDGGANTEYFQTYYCVATEPDYGLLTVPDSVFSFRTLYGAIIDNKWQDPNATLYIKNENVKSREIQVGQSKSLRLQNASYAVIKNNKSQSFYRDYVTDLIPEFTLSICYKCDFHPDDDRTVLSFAKCNSQYTPNQGILIRDHKLYVAQNTFDLQDNELMSIAITFQALSSAGVGNVFLYVNGVVESVFENMSVSSIIPVDADQMTIGAQVENDTEMFYTDMNVFRVSMYNKCLSPIDVLYEFLNDQACANIKNGNPDTDKISDGLKRNFISVTDDGNRSLLYNDSMTFSNNEQDYSQFFSINNLVSVAGGLQLKEEMKNMIIPIPIMTLDVSNSDIWTWSNFIQANNNLGDNYTACTFQYYDQTATNDNIVSGSCSVKVQGTSTLSDVIKNLSVKFDDDSIFIPKETWFPEQTYTLKADIVDSSHSLNASIGRFVNEEFGMRYNTDGSLQSTDSWYPFSDTVKNEYIKAKNSGSIFSKYFPKATLKHGVEGFPVFVIINFKSTSSTTTSVHSLGIYQFILGRESPRNLGYEIIDSISFGGGEPQLTYPLYAQNVTMTTKTNMGYWFEANQNDAFGQDTKFQEADKLTDKKLTGIFWQNDRDYYDSIIQIKYNNLGSAAVSQPSDFAPLRQFIQNIIHLPVTNRRYSIFGSQYLVRNTFANHTYPVYTSYMTSSSGRQWKESAGQVNTMYSTSGDDLNTTVDNLNLRSYAKYFVIAMLFGLIDNFEKNMPLKFYWKKDKDGKYQYKDGQPEYEIPILGIYDTDTGIGGDNQGLLDVKETVWLSTLENVGGALVETSATGKTDVTNIIGQNNKLWYFDSGEVNYAIGGSKDGSLYTDSWIQMLKQIHNNNMPLQVDYNLQDIVDVYYNNYFLKQTNGCGELLFNLTYFSKYLNKYVSNGNIVNQANKLHGRRQQQIKRWLEKRVVFLDSIFQAMGTYQENQIISPSTVSITSGQSPQFKITANNPIVTKVSHQSQDNCQYLIMDTNDKIDIYWGASEPATQAVNHTVSQSDSIQALGDNETSLSDIYFVKINNGTLPYLTSFDAHSCQALGADDNALTKFKKTGAVSQLREIDLSNTSKPKGSEINYNLDLSDGFEKLQKLNLYNSCVTTIRLPKGQNSIPLMRFDIRGCQLTSLELADQNLLDSLDLTGCDRLSQLQISSCNSLRTLSLDKTQSSLDSIDIASDTFQSISCTDNDSVRTVQIQSSMLESVVFKNCTKLQSATIICNDVQTIDFSGCTNLATVTLVSPQDSIVKIDLSGTSVTVFRGSTTDTETNEVDLSRFKQISDFGIQNNNKVKYIRFRNDKDNPISITRRFAASSLLRVYGHISVKVTSGAFAECRSFSILGPDMTYDGVSMVADDGRVKHFTEVPAVVDGNKPKFQTGNYATNITFAASDLRYAFSNSACTILDAYYALYNIGSVARTLYCMFLLCPNINFSFSEQCDNSPHRKTFVNCAEITSISYMFYSTGSSEFRIYSPSHDEAGNITADDGLFSPLRKAESIERCFGAYAAVDRYMLRTTGWQYKINTMDYTYGVIVDDVAKLTKYPDDQYILDNIHTAGNLNKFFYDVPDIRNLCLVFNDTPFINYDLTDEMYCPATVIAKSFCSTYATGTIDIDKLFINKNFIVQLTGSCYSSGGGMSSQIHNTVPKASFTIRQGMLDGMTKLQQIGCNPSYGDFSSTYSSASFTGSEIERKFGDKSFPYEIFKDQPGLVSADAFFKDVQQGELANGIVGLPGTLFNKCTYLTSVKGLFCNIGIDFSLTSGSFSNCKNLQDVSELFSGCGSHFNGSIPVRFFYHGENQASVTYTGANLWNEDHTDYKYNPFDRIQNEDGTITERGIDEADLETITITYRACNTKITGISHAFKGCSIQVYQNESPEIENNADYMPFTHIVSNGRVSVATYNDKEKTFIWSFDGVNIPDGYDGENLDEEHDSANIGQITLVSDVSSTCTEFFAFPPDLLRYCSWNISTTLDIFEDCGYLYYNASKNYLSPDYETNPDYGLHGRIVPYMLKPVSGVKDVSRMFQNCKLLSYYTTGTGINYIIPKTFFKYAPNIQNMTYTFRGITIPANADLDVFGYMKQALNIYGLFYICRWNGTSSLPITVNGIFKNKQILDLYRAFSVNDDDNQISFSAFHRNGYVVFDGVFTPGKITKQKDRCVFDGFDKNTVKFQNKTLSQDNISADVRHNYRTSG